jgi:CO/xanthine dehydrogenase Mo-binding subunit
VIGDVQTAVAPGAPLVTDREIVPGLFHGLGELAPRDGNVCYRYRIDRGELEAVFARADIVVEGEYSFPAVYQYAMETHTVIAQVEGDEITLWATCQHPFLVRAEIADLFGVPVANVRIQVPYLGGGFGSKSYTKMEPLTVALARKAGRPVRIQNRVSESMVTTRRHNMWARMRTAATADGRLLARDVECLFDTGAYADNGPRVVATGGDAAPGPYRLGRVTASTPSCVYTNPRARRLVPRLRRDAPRSGSANRRVDEVARRAGARPARRAPPEPVHAGRGGARGRASRSTPTSSATSRRPRRPVGWDEEKQPLVGRGVSVGAARGRRAPGLERRLPARGGRPRVVLVSTTEMGQGRGPRSRRSPPRRSASSRSR